MKKTLLTALMVLFAVAAFAQKGSVTATLVDADTGDEVIGAVLTLTPSATPDKKQYATSAYKGLISFPSLSYGEYGLSISFLGYNTLDTTFRVSAPKVNLGVLRLKPHRYLAILSQSTRTLMPGRRFSTGAVGRALTANVRISNPPCVRVAAHVAKSACGAM